MFSNAKRIVIKIGSSLLIGADGHVREHWLATLAEDILSLRRQGKQLVVVTSGAVALGRHVLGYGDKKLALEEKQAAAAAGQTPLMARWAEAFSGEASPAQLLLTADDSIHRKRYLNARATLETLLEHPRTIPVINENDTVATAELRFGDNDRLAARVAQMIEADWLVLFSDVDGLYSANPTTDNGAEFIPIVERITPEIEKMAGGAASTVSSGGMRTKIEAAKIATMAGCHMAIAQGAKDHPLKALVEGGRHTHFIAQGNPKSARKHWIAGSMHAAGIITVDDGAAKALASGKSLLPAGVTAIHGTFDRGDTVEIKDRAGALLAKGLAAYDHEEARKIMGQQSSDIERLLGYKSRDVLIHRDDMVLE